MAVKISPPIFDKLKFLTFNSENKDFEKQISISHYTVLNSRLERGVKKFVMYRQFICIFKSQLSSELEK